MAQPQSHYSLGMRGEIRDADWRVKRVDYSADDGYLLGWEGLSELVQGREGLFLTELDLVRILAPEDTQLNEGIHYAVHSPDFSPYHQTEDVALGWDDIKHLPSGTVAKIFLDDTLPRPQAPPEGPVARGIIYQAPFFKPEREQDYRIAWAFCSSATDNNNQG